MLRRVFIMALAVGVCCGLASPGARALEPARVLPPISDVMHVGGEVLAPSAFQDFCRRTPDECAPDLVRSSRMTMTAQRWQDLIEINDVVNQTVLARSDQDLFGVVDYWTIAGKYGDCEDYALTKQQMLRQRGWPMGSVLITVVRDENGEGHAILTARTTRGDFVLDNRQPKVVAWTVTPYQYIKRQSVLSPRIWLALAPGLTPPRESTVAAVSGSKR
jgi:predicted transglutaminase-like cysteine proteinase